MDPNEIKLDRLSKEFEYHKLATEVDNCDSIDELKNIAKSYIKLYFKQQEVVGGFGVFGK